MASAAHSASTWRSSRETSVPIGPVQLTSGGHGESSTTARKPDGSCCITAIATRELGHAIQVEGGDAEGLAQFGKVFHDID